ncbi:LysR substrate-binding domain-containing protein [Microvirga sp. GCM10011540]|uniref:LysR substrate-binding domain-containing protein n=1 Tax=Microvirga sp. GCM10011540 TaxID=3317338 RepID=UPI0036094B4C
MNFRQLETFRAVMHSGSASRAAELLQITQPSVSRSIAELEETVGFALFNRVRSRLVPTPEAKLLLREVDRSFVGLERLRAEVARIRDFGSGSIRIASLAALGNTIVPRAIRAFQAKHSDIALTLQVHPTTRVRELVGSGEFDIGLAADEVDLSGVEHRTFGSFRAVCAIPPGHPLSARRTITPEDLDGVPFVALAPEDRARQRFDAVLEAAGVRSKIVVETPGSSTVCALVLEGVGVGLVNPASADGFPERGLVFRPFEPAVYFKSILLFRPDAQQARLVREFVAALLQARDTRQPLAETPPQ